MRIAVGDIGGTHARFALAELTPGAAPMIGTMRKYRTREHGGLAAAWARFGADSGGRLPDAAAFGVAAPIEGDELRFANSAWVIDRRSVAAELGLDRLLLLNDFEAVAHAVPVVPLRRLGGPEGELPAVTTVMGPGTGLGVSILTRREGRAEVIATEGAHIAFAPQDAAQTELEATLRARYGRCSVERIVSGPGLLDIFAHLGGRVWDAQDAGALWTAATEGGDPLAGQALDLLVACFGAAAGDLTLAHGSMALVITGALANRMAGRLAAPLFHAPFTAKGRFAARMARIPVLLAAEPEPGLFGAAVAFQQMLVA